MAEQHDNKNKKSGRTESNTGKDTFTPPGDEKGIGAEQTTMPNEQDPKRRIGNFTGRGEAPRKQP